MYIGNDSDYQGFLGIIDNGGSVSNLGVSGYIKGGNYVGGGAGYSFSSIITNCYSLQG